MRTFSVRVAKSWPNESTNRIKIGKAKFLGILEIGLVDCGSVIKLLGNAAYIGTSSTDAPAMIERSGTHIIEELDLEAFLSSLVSEREAT